MKVWQIVSVVAVLAGVGGVVEKRIEAGEKTRDRSARSSRDAVTSEDAPRQDDHDDEAARAALRAMQRSIAMAAESHAAVDAAPQAAPVAKDTPKPRAWAAEDLRDFYTATFTGENSDGAWAASARRLAETRLRDDLPAGSTLRAIDCRSSMCRIETSHEDPQKYQEFVRKSFGEPATGIWNGGAFSTIVQGGSDGAPMVVVTYLAREGTDLPEPVAAD